MKPTFLTYEKPILTVILQCTNPDTAIGRIRKALDAGAEAFGLQVESLERIYQNPETIRKIFAEMQGKPIYVTNYRKKANQGKSDEELAQGLMMLADCGATLCDVMGDMFCLHPEELTDDAQAIERQMALIEQLHSRGAEVLMSSHVLKYTPAERVLEIAHEQKRRGADVIKIVTGAENMEQQIENLRITHLLKENLDAPYLFLSGGECKLHRRIGPNLGCCMYLCVYEHDEYSTKSQPLLHKVKCIRDNMEWD